MVLVLVEIDKTVLEMVHFNLFYCVRKCNLNDFYCKLEVG